MDGLIEKSFKKIWQTVAQSLDVTLSEVKDFYKQSITGNTYNAICDTNELVLRAGKDSKTLLFKLTKIIAPSKVGLVRFTLNETYNIKTGSDIFELDEGVNVINQTYMLTDDIWSSMDSIKITWTFEPFEFQDQPSTRTLPSLTLCFQVCESGI